MRDFFINSFEKLIGVLVILMALGVLVGSVVAMLNPSQGGIFAGLFFLVFGSLYVILMGGFFYMALGIYHNTRRSAEALERLEKK
ncbi:hypothetical protein AB9F26_11010 [Falsihalocynthiibacter sp. BN13B15]|uniref:hypothetical protein n=1 Tax=Falsihalocynthiibacter sp. BN13B15 TaxID=3240871 RepID=UPI0035108171